MRSLAPLVPIALLLAALHLLSGRHDSGEAGTVFVVFERGLVARIWKDGV
jgi:hypothetical protein